MKTPLLRRYMEYVELVNARTGRLVCFVPSYGVTFDSFEGLRAWAVRFELVKRRPRPADREKYAELAWR